MELNVKSISFSALQNYFNSFIHIIIKILLKHGNLFNFTLNAAFSENQTNANF